MPLNRLKESEIRSFGKEYIESLEYWLRNIIDNELRDAYGVDYIHTMKNSTDYVFKKSIRDEVDSRMATEPERYSRPIDACLLETEITILTKPDLYNAFFKKYFIEAYPLGRDMLLTTLNRLIYPRNCLYHANPISIRQLEQIVCYTNDVITSIKKYYKNNNMNQDFNVPKIIRITDSFGNNTFRESFNPKDHVAVSIQRKENILYVGDTLKIEVEVDSSFSRNNYSIRWLISKTGCQTDVPNENSILLLLENKHVAEDLQIYCYVKSNEDWHRGNDYDDSIIFRYKVLPRK